MPDPFAELPPGAGAQQFVELLPLASRSVSIVYGDALAGGRGGINGAGIARDARRLADGR